MAFENKRWQARPVPASFPPTKRCRGACGLVRLREDFGSKPTHADMRDSRCKSCRAATVKARKALVARVGHVSLTSGRVRARS